MLLRAVPSFSFLLKKRARNGHVQEVSANLGFMHMNYRKENPIAISYFFKPGRCVVSCKENCNQFIVFLSLLCWNRFLKRMWSSNYTGGFDIPYSKIAPLSSPQMIVTMDSYTAYFCYKINSRSTVGLLIV